jgi:hypothetical protein
MNWRELMRIQNSEKHGKKSHPERYVLAGTEGNSEPQKALTKLTEPRPDRTPINIIIAKVEPASPERETNTCSRQPVSDPDPAGYPAEIALTIIRHLRGYVLPAGRMPVARAIAARLRPLLASADLDLADTVRRLIAVEDELTRLGGQFDPELAEAIEVVTRTFPGSKLVH